MQHYLYLIMVLYQIIRGHCPPAPPPPHPTSAAYASSFIMCPWVYHTNWKAHLKLEFHRENRTHRAASGRGPALLQHQGFRPDAARCVRFPRWNSSFSFSFRVCIGNQLHHFGRGSFLSAVFNRLYNIHDLVIYQWRSEHCPI